MSLDMMDLPVALREIVQNEMRPMERVRWCGRPKPSRMAIKSLPIFLFAIPFTGFAVFWIAMASKGIMAEGERGPGMFFPLFGLPFLLIGLAMMTAPLWAMRKAKSTVYVVTDQRAIVFAGARSISIESFGPDKLKGRARKQRPDGSGDIIFERRASYHGSRHRETYKDIGFLGIGDVRPAEEAIRYVIEEASRES